MDSGYVMLAIHPPINIGILLKAPQQAKDNFSLKQNLFLPPFFVFLLLFLIWFGFAVVVLLGFFVWLV